MKTIRVMDSTGDTRVSFEPGTQEETEARELFGRLTGKGAAAFSIAPGGESRKVKSFDELGDETVIVPAIVGG